MDLKTRPLIYDLSESERSRKSERSRRLFFSNINFSGEDVIRILQKITKLYDRGILMKFFKIFDQNTVGKLQWQTYQMTLEFFKIKEFWLEMQL